MSENEKSFDDVSSADCPILIITTVASSADAKKISETLIGEKLAACISQFPITSTYFWEGEIKTESEIQLLMKTSRQRAQDLMKRIQEIHPYSTPEILEVAVHSASKSYAKWVTEMTCL
jgi:periplasmic divalent cation tolerance protein